MTEEIPINCDDTTDNDELRELVKEWRGFADVPGWDGYSNGVREATKSCADELEAVINNGG